MLGVFERDDERNASFIITRDVSVLFQNVYCRFFLAQKKTFFAEKNTYFPHSPVRSEENFSLLARC